MQKLLVKSKRPISSGRGKEPQDRATADLLRDGVIVIDKPAGPTSHQVTSWVADIVGAAKAAHGGTLDPRVTGVLPVGLGDAVRAMDALHVGTKAYVGVMRMHGNIDLKRLGEVFKEFTDEIYQTPPMRSAVRRELTSRCGHSQSPRFRGTVRAVRHPLWSRSGGCSSGRRSVRRPWRSPAPSGAASARP